MTADWIKLLLDCIPAAAILLGALYTLYEYRRFRRYSPKIQFDVDFNLHPIDGTSGNYLVDIEMTVKNVGQVRMYFPEIYVGVKTLGKDDLDNALKTKKRFYFKRELIPKANIADREDPWWVDPGVTQVFPYPVAIKEPNDFVQVNTVLYYYKNIEKYKRASSNEKKKLREGYHQASLVKPIKT